MKQKLKLTNPFFDTPLQSGQNSVLGKRFRWPPFTVLNAQTGKWQDRKRQWISLGIKSELGRGEALTWEEGVQDIDEYRHREGTKGKKPDARAFNEGGLDDLDDYKKELTGRKLAQTYRSDEYAVKYRQANAAPGGSPLPATDYSKSKARGDGHGRPMLAEPGRGGSKVSSTVLRDHGRGERKKYHAQPGSQPSTGSVWLNANSQPVGGATALNASKGLNLQRNGSLTYDIGVAAYEYPDKEGQSGTSIFDPVLCELAYRWFCPIGGTILDPYSGGSVRGIMASLLERKYVGVDLRPEQLEANRAQGEKICIEQPTWIEGDSRNLIDVIEQKHDKNFWADMVFTCPPYFDLELYSGDKRDLSNTSWREFRRSYADIIDQAVSMLRNNRFACFVVGDVRDKKGFYRALQSLTIQCFERAGCRYYNEAILLTAVGSLPLRAHQQFDKSRKIARGHQYVQVFVKGDPWVAAKKCERIETLSIDTARCLDFDLPPIWRDRQ